MIKALFAAAVTFVLVYGPSIAEAGSPWLDAP